MWIRNWVSICCLSYVKHIDYFSTNQKDKYWVYIMSNSNLFHSHSNFFKLSLSWDKKLKVTFRFSRQAAVFNTKLENFRQVLFPKKLLCITALDTSFECHFWVFCITRLEIKTRSIYCFGGGRFNPVVDQPFFFCSPDLLLKNSVT